MKEFLTGGFYWLFGAVASLAVLTVVALIRRIIIKVFGRK